MKEQIKWILFSFCVEWLGWRNLRQCVTSLSSLEKQLVWAKKVLKKCWYAIFPIYHKSVIFLSPVICTNNINQCTWVCRGCCSRLFSWCCLISVCYAIFPLNNKLFGLSNVFNSSSFLQSISLSLATYGAKVWTSAFSEQSVRRPAAVPILCWIPMWCFCALCLSNHTTTTQMHRRYALASQSNIIMYQHFTDRFIFIPSILTSWVSETCTVNVACASSLFIH